MLRDPRRRALAPDDFLPGPRRRQDWRDQLAWVRTINAALGGRDETDRKD